MDTLTKEAAISSVAKELRKFGWCAVIEADYVSIDRQSLIFHIGFTAPTWKIIRYTRRGLAAGEALDALDTKIPESVGAYGIVALELNLMVRDYQTFFEASQLVAAAV